jgi:hypothetical protein
LSGDELDFGIKREAEEEEESMGLKHRTGDKRDTQQGTIERI